MYFVDLSTLTWRKIWKHHNDKFLFLVSFAKTLHIWIWIVWLENWKSEKKTEKTQVLLELYSNGDYDYNHWTMVYGKKWWKKSKPNFHGISFGIVGSQKKNKIILSLSIFLLKPSSPTKPKIIINFPHWSKAISRKTANWISSIELSIDSFEFLEWQSTLKIWQLFFPLEDFW